MFSIFSQDIQHVRNLANLEARSVTHTTSSTQGLLQVLCGADASIPCQRPSCSDVILVERAPSAFPLQLTEAVERWRHKSPSPSSVPRCQEETAALDAQCGACWPATWSHPYYSCHHSGVGLPPLILRYLTLSNTI